MFTRRCLWAGIVMLGFAFAPAPLAQAQTVNCQFVLGFATLDGMIPRIVGHCVDNEGHNPVNGDGLQHTITPQGGPGLLAWRKADNWTAFTDGFHTWVNGPDGLEYRLNSQRFAWEANSANLPIVADVYGAGPLSLATAHQAGARLRVSNSPFGTGQGPLIFDIAGSGFAAGETVTIQGTYTPAFLIPTGNAQPQSPFSRQACDPVALGPVQVTSDGSGRFTATLTGNTNLLQGGDLSITASGTSGDTTTLGGGGSLPQVAALPAGCRT